MEKVIKNKLIDPVKYSLADKETGEEIFFKKGGLVVKEETNFFTINYKNFVYLDIDKILFFCNKGLKMHQLGLLTVLASTLTLNKTNSFLDKNNSPLSAKAISEVIGYSQTATKNLLNELELFGLIWYGKIPEYKKKVYVLNPHFIRRGKEFSKTIVCHFFENGADPNKLNSKSLNKRLESKEPSSQ